MSIKYLVLEGGGVKGTAYIGALKVLDQVGILQNIQGVAGSSIGSIVALLIACGYTYQEIHKIVFELDLEEFADDKCCSCACFKWFSHFRGGFGRYKGDKMREYIGSLIKKKLKTSSITFKQLYKKTGKDLIVTGTNLDIKQTVYFSRRNYPNMLVKDAVRISSAIPFYFDAVFYGGDTYVDGGLLNNYPLNIFDNDGNGVLDADILGCKLVSKDEASPINDLYIENQDIDGVIDFGKCLINTMIVEIDRLHQQLNDRDYKQTVVIGTDDISSTDLDLTLNEKNYLIDAGQEAMMVFLEKKGFSEASFRDLDQASSSLDLSSTLSLI